ncbi:MAG: HAD family hydrolase [Thermoleophilaceae bacterium]
MALRAVLLDALGTLVELRPPAPRLRAAIGRRSGVDIGVEAAERGFAAEIEHYLANHIRGGDEQGLDRLRDECAEVMRTAIDRPELDHAAVRAAMLESLEFAAFPDVVPALTELRERGLRLVVVSNWDCSLPRWLAAAGLDGLLDGAVSSAAVGVAKPGAAVFEAGLELAGCAAAEAVHAGDSLGNDVEGARAAGLRGILVQREGEAPVGVEAVASLRELSGIV